MNSLDAFCGLLAAAPRGVVLLSHDEVEAWSRPLFDALLDAGVVSEAQPSLTVRCDACDEGHVETPEVVGDGRSRRAYVVCPRYGRVWVDLARLRQWRCDLEMFASAFSRLLGLTQAPTRVAEGSVFRLGPLPVAGATWQTFLATSPSELTGFTRRYRRLLAFVLVSSPTQLEPPSVPVSQLLTIDRGRLACDWRYLESECAVLEPSAQTPGHDGTRRGGRRPGTSFGALLDCWMTCGALGDRFDSPSDAYNAIEAYLDRHPRPDVQPPIRARYSSARSYAVTARKKQSRCTWRSHPEPLPSELVSE